MKPNSGYTRDPFLPTELEGKIYGLGSNDAGASVVSLWTVFLSFARLESLNYNLIFAATAEEEISGKNGIETLIPFFVKEKNVTCALVGEPTEMQMAVAEKGLLVLDCVMLGRAGHAARDPGGPAHERRVDGVG